MSLCVFLTFALAASATRADDAEPAAEKFICVKMRKVGLAEFKKRMVAECDLNKPFSISSSDSMLEGSFLYCCHTK